MENIQDKFHYEPVAGNEKLVEISRIENGKKLSVIFETFSEEQIRLFQRVSQADFGGENLHHSKNSSGRNLSIVL